MTITYDDDPSVGDLIEMLPTSIALEGTVNVKYRITEESVSTNYRDLDFTLTYQVSTCTKSWNMPTGSLSMTYEL